MDTLVHYLRTMDAAHPEPIANPLITIQKSQTTCPECVTVRRRRRRTTVCLHKHEHLPAGQYICRCGGRFEV
jgi:hypothetical protein